MVWLCVDGRYVALLHARPRAVERLLSLGASPTHAARGGTSLRRAAAAHGWQLIVSPPAAAAAEEAGHPAVAPATEASLAPGTAAAMPEPEPEPTPARHRPRFQLARNPHAEECVAAAVRKRRFLRACAEQDVQLASGAKAVPHILIPHGAAHPGAGSFFVDGALPDSFLAALDALLAGLPLAERKKKALLGANNDRSYYCDAEGWITAALASAVGQCFPGGGGALPGQGAGLRGTAMMYMRFLLYNESGGGLPPHTDLARTDPDGNTSRHTFILYLTDCHVGGTTVLLDRLSQPCTPIASVAPKRGRLFVFPHACPHMAVAVETPDVPKQILRGEML